MKKIMSKKRGFGWWCCNWRNRGDKTGCPMGGWCPIHGDKDSSRQEVVGWALIFIFGALVLLVDTTEISSSFSWWNAWSVFFIGFGAITLVGMFIYLFKGKTGRVIWNLLWGSVFLTIGLRNFTNPNWVWIVVLAGLGLLLLKRGFKNN